MSGTTGYFDIVNSNIMVPYTGASNYDMVIRTEGMGQRMFIGNSNGGVPAIVISSNMVGIGKSNPSYPLDVVGNVSLGAPSTSNVGNICAGNLGMFRNRIINGDMRVAQRFGFNVEQTITSSSAYTLDRWKVQVDTGTVNVVQQSSGLLGFPFIIRLQQSIAGSVTAGTNSVGQCIEGYNIADLGWGTASAIGVTLSFWVNATQTGTYAYSLRNSAANMSYVGTYTIVATNTWQYVSAYIPGPTSGTWLSDNGIGIDFRFVQTRGVPAPTVGQWLSGNYTSASTVSSNLVGTQFSSIHLTGVQIEKGTIATPFEFRPYQIELSLCKRYFCKFGNGSSSSRLCSGNWYNTTQGYFFIVPQEDMRVIPTSFTYSTAGKALLEGINWYDISSITLSGDTTTHFFLMNFTSTASSAVGGSMAWWGGGGATGPVAYFSAEL